VCLRAFVVAAAPSNNEMQLTRSACERSRRPLQLISVFCGPRGRAMKPRRIVLCRGLLALAAWLIAPPSFGGGATFPATIQNYHRAGQDSATFTVAFESAPDGLPSICKKLEVRARYAWWVWWWDDLGGRINRQAHDRTLDFLSVAATKGARVEFGYMGQGWKAPDSALPCSVVSNALASDRDLGHPSGDAVYSFYSVP
jgi:hypothetical protein